MTGFLGDLSGQDRIEAVHQTFSEHSSSDALGTVLWIGLIGIVLIGLLFLLHRGQRFLQKQQSARTAPPTPRPRREQILTSSSKRPTNRPVRPRSPVKSRP